MHGTVSFTSSFRRYVPYFLFKDTAQKVCTSCSVTYYLLSYLLTYLLTYSMGQSPSWEANRFAASQEIPRISRNPKVHYRYHKRPPPVSILGQPNPVHIPTSHLLEIHPNIIRPSMPRSPQWSPSPRFPHEEPINPALLTHTRHMPSPSTPRSPQWSPSLRFPHQDPIHPPLLTHTRHMFSDKLQNCSPNEFQ